MVALAGRPSLHSCDACIGFKRHPGEIAGKNMVRPLFFLERFFCLVEIPLNGFGVCFSGIDGWGGLRILGLVLPIILLSQADRWISPRLAVRALFDYDRWPCCVTQPVRFSPLWPASWLPAVDKSRGSKSVEVRRVWDVYDDAQR